MEVNWQSDTPKMVKWQSDAPKMELKVPSEVKIDGGGYPPYELPVATKEVLGGVKVDGDTINITSDGVISTQKVSDSVKYTPQTLTDEQKKQARENIGAIDTANGLLPVECVLPFGFHTRNQTVFVKNGVMLPLDYSTATGDMKTAISRFGLLLNSSNMTPAIIDVSVEAFATLIENGIFGNDFYGSYTWPSNMLYIYDSQFSPKTVINMWSYYSASDSRKGFALCVTKANGNTFTRAYNTTTSEYVNNYIDYTSIPLAAYASDSGDTPSIQQVEMAAAPNADMQIATKKYVDDSVPDAVLYTAQTLTDEQKKQVRDNVGAEESNNGLLKKELYYQLKTSYAKNPIITYIKEGDITQFEDSEPNNSDVRKAFVFLALVMGKAGGVAYNNSTFQAQTKQLYAAYQAGLLQLPLTCYANPYYGTRQLIRVTYTSDYFDVKAIYEDGSGFDYGYKPSTDTFVDGTYTGYSMHAKSYQALTTPPSIEQFSMAAAPTSDMEIATKKYVDDHAGGGGGEAQLNYNISSTATFTEQDKEVIKSAIKFGTGFFIDNFKVIRIMSIGSRRVFIVLKPNGATDNHVVGYQVDIDADKNVTSSVFSTFIDYVLIGSNSAISGDIITSDNWESYININAGDWIQTTKNDSNLYNAKQLWVIGIDGGKYYEGIFRFDYSAATTILGDCTSVDFYLGDFTFSYDGTSLNSLGTILAVYYKT